MDSAWTARGSRRSPPRKLLVLSPSRPPCEPEPPRAQIQECLPSCPPHPADQPPRHRRSSTSDLPRVAALGSAGGGATDSGAPQAMYLSLSPPTTGKIISVLSLSKDLGKGARLGVRKPTTLPVRSEVELMMWLTVKMSSARPLLKLPQNMVFEQYEVV